MNQLSTELCDQLTNVSGYAKGVSDMTMTRTTAVYLLWYSQPALHPGRYVSQTLHVAVVTRQRYDVGPKHTGSQALRINDMKQQCFWYQFLLHAKWCNRNDIFQRIHADERPVHTSD